MEKPKTGNVGAELLADICGTRDHCEQVAKVVLETVNAYVTPEEPPPPEPSEETAVRTGSSSIFPEMRSELERIRLNLDAILHHINRL